MSTPDQSPSRIVARLIRAHWPKLAFTGSLLMVGAGCADQLVVYVPPQKNPQGVDLAQMIATPTIRRLGGEPNLLTQPATPFWATQEGTLPSTRIATPSATHREFVPGQTETLQPTPTGMALSDWKGGLIFADPNIFNMSFANLTPKLGENEGTPAYDPGKDDPMKIVEQLITKAEQEGKVVIVPVIDISRHPIVLGDGTVIYGNEINHASIRKFLDDLKAKYGDSIGYIKISSEEADPEADPEKALQSGKPVIQMRHIDPEFADRALTVAERARAIVAEEMIRYLRDTHEYSESDIASLIQVINGSVSLGTPDRYSDIDLMTLIPPGEKSDDLFHDTEQFFKWDKQKLAQRLRRETGIDEIELSSISHLSVELGANGKIVRPANKNILLDLYGYPSGGYKPDKVGGLISMAAVGTVLIIPSNDPGGKVEANLSQWGSALQYFENYKKYPEILAALHTDVPRRMWQQGVLAMLPQFLDYQEASDELIRLVWLQERSEGFTAGDLLMDPEIITSGQQVLLWLEKSANERTIAAVRPDEVKIFAKKHRALYDLMKKILTGINYPTLKEQLFILYELVPTVGDRYSRNY